MSKTHLLLAFVAIVALRIAVGYHFFKEGTSKLNDGFTAEYFLKGAKGPLAPAFNSLLGDVDGKFRLCAVTSTQDDGDVKINIDASLTNGLWNDYVDQAVGYYRFGDAELEESLIEQRKQLAEDIRAARDSYDKSVNTVALQSLRDDIESDILRIRTQRQDAEEILSAHQEQLQDWLSGNQTELIAHFSTANRLNGFERDGVNRSDVALNVESIREQVDTIKSDRQKQLGGWLAEVEVIWDSFESQIQSLPVATQADKAPLALHRPFAQEYSKLNLINGFIPWFDTIIGVLLILGLFTRFASLSAALFLASVILSQPAWIPGTRTTYYESVEFFALLVIFATCAGRFGGLDFFLHRKPKQPTPVDEN